LSGSAVFRTQNLVEKKERRTLCCTDHAISNRLLTGKFHIMFGTHRKFPDKFFLYHKMSRTSFDDVLSLICDESVRTDTDVGTITGPMDRLAVTLR
jgi:hypothetical protein